MEQEFVEGDRATKFKVLAFAGILLLLILLALLTSPDAELRARDPAQAIEKSVRHLLLLALTATPLFVGASIYLLRLAIRGKRSDQYPPPGMRVAVRTQIRRGTRAKCHAILMFLLAGVMLAVIPVLFYGWHLASSVASIVSELGPP